MSSSDDIDPIALIDAIGLGLLALAKGGGASIAQVSDDDGARFVTDMIARDGAQAAAVIDRVGAKLTAGISSLRAEHADAATDAVDIGKVVKPLQTIIRIAEFTPLLRELADMSRATPTRDTFDRHQLITLISAEAVAIARHDTPHGDLLSDLLTERLLALLFRALLDPTGAADAQSNDPGPDPAQPEGDPVVARSAPKSNPQIAPLAEVSEALAVCIRKAFSNVIGRDLTPANRSAARFVFEARLTADLDRVRAEVLRLADLLGLPDAQRARIAETYDAGDFTQLDSILRGQETVTVRHMTRDIAQTESAKAIAVRIRCARATLRQLVCDCEGAARHFAMARRHVPRNDPHLAHLELSAARSWYEAAVINGNVNALDTALLACRDGVQRAASHGDDTIAREIDLTAATILLARGRLRDRPADFATAMRASEAASASDQAHVRDAAVELRAHAAREASRASQDPEDSTSAAYQYENEVMNPHVRELGALAVLAQAASTASNKDTAAIASDAIAKVLDASTTTNDDQLTYVASSGWAFAFSDFAFYAARLTAQAARASSATDDLIAAAEQLDRTLAEHASDYSPGMSAVLESDLAALMRHGAALRGDPVLAQTADALDGLRADEVTNALADSMTSADDRD